MTSKLDGGLSGALHTLLEHVQHAPPLTLGLSAPTVTP